MTMNCPVCLETKTVLFGQGTDFFFETSAEDFALYSCVACHCLFLNPMPNPEKIASFYHSNYWQLDEQPFGFLRKAEKFYQRLVLTDHIRFISRAAHGTAGATKASILDVGCGSGFILGVLKKKGFRVAGVDFSPKAAEVASIDHGVDVQIGDLESISFSEREFDVILMLHTLEHLANPRAILEEVARILSDQGRLVLQVPNIESIQFKLFGARWYGLDVPRHLVNYSSESLFRLLSESGFTIERVRHFNLRDNAPAFASSLFPSLDPVSRSVRARQNESHESLLGAWLRDVLYLSAVVASYPLAVIEAALGRGATVMVEAKKLLWETPK